MCCSISIRCLGWSRVLTGSVLAVGLRPLLNPRVGVRVLPRPPGRASEELRVA